MTTIAICGSMKFAKEMELCRKELQNKGFDVFAPHATVDISGYKESGSTEEAIERKVQNDYIRAHYNLIKQSEGILVLNYDKNGITNYISGNTLMEMGFAFTMNRDIFLLNGIPDVPYKSEIAAMQPIIINENFDEIAKHYENLPKVYISSENKLKISATSKALRELNYKEEVIGLKTVSGISEEPTSIEETYNGAENRLADLKRSIKDKKWKFLVSIESGITNLHRKHNVWGFSVCIIENSQGKRSVTINTDLEIPKDMTDLVPSEYPDLGVLVQEKFGIKDKDPYLYFTNGKLSREKLLFNSVVNTLVSL